MTARKVEISERTILFTLGILGLIWVVIMIREVIVILFVAIILMSALAPWVQRLQNFKVPKVLAIASLYILIIGLVAFMVSIFVTPLIEQTNTLAQTLPRMLRQTLPTNIFDVNVLAQQVGSFTGNVVTATFTILNQIVGIISVVVLTFYLLLEHDKLIHMIGLFTFGHDGQVKNIVERVEVKLGAWFRGQVVLSVIIGVAAFIALTILHVPYALPLAIVAGLMEVVPVIGPIISAVPAVLVAYLTSPLLAALTIVAFFIIQQLENHVVVPQVMRKAVGLNPLIVILAVAIGGKLLGIIGALLAVPIAVTIQVVLEEYRVQGFASPRDENHLPRSKRVYKN
jgi:predicted PurR-regulated permease PerM